MPDPNAAVAGSPVDRTRPWLLLALGLAVYAALQFGRLGSPLLWQDEGETAMFGQRVLEHGYPKVHGERNVVYGMSHGRGVPLALAVDERDAYIGSLWGQYYFAAIGVWLAGHADDPHARTRLLRLPFALAGCLGLAMLFLAAAPAFANGAGGTPRAAAAFSALLCLSTSLILHLREVRYYALGVALLGALVLLYERAFAPGRHPSPGPVGNALRILLLALLLLLLFNVFHPAALAAALWLALEAGLCAWRMPAASRSERVRAALPIGAALAAAAALALPLAFAFEIPTLARLYTTRMQFGVGVYLDNLGLLLEYLLRYELLGPVLAVQLLLLPLRAAKRRASPTARADRLSAALSRLCLVYALVVAHNPFFFERYFVPLSPLLGLVLLLDATSLARRVLHPARPQARGRAKLALAALLAIVLAALLVVKRAELMGQFAELRRPYRGPLDFIVADVRARHPDTARLTIATNYELEPLMYYLGSHVIGRLLHPVGARAAAEKSARVDLVIPRTRQRKKLEFVRSFLDRGAFERVELPVADLPFNNVPELFEGRHLSMTHRFRTVRPDEERPPLAIYYRRDAGGARP